MAGPDGISSLDRLRYGPDGEFIERSIRQLIDTDPTPDDLIQYSLQFFGPTKRLAAVQVCETMIDLHHQEGNAKAENSYLTVLPILWGLIDEALAT